MRVLCVCAGALASSTAAGEVQLIEGRLSWLVHIIGAIIQGRMSSNLGESQVRPARVAAGSSWVAWQCRNLGAVMIGASMSKLESGLGCAAVDLALFSWRKRHMSETELVWQHGSMACCAGCSLL